MVNNIAQEIDIYKQLPTSYRNRIPLYKIFRTIGLLLVLLLLVSFCQKTTVIIKQFNLNRVLAEKNQAQSELLALQKKYPKIAKNVSLQTKKDEASTILALHKELKNTIARPSFTNDQGLSAILIDLSKNIVPDLWLTEINIQKGGTDVTINGITQEVVAVNEFLSKLTEDELYKGYSLKIKRMETSVSSPGNDDFAISIVGLTAEGQKPQEQINKQGKV